MNAWISMEIQISIRKKLEGKRQREAKNKKYSTQNLYFYSTPFSFIIIKKKNRKKKLNVKDKCKA